MASGKERTLASGLLSAATLNEGFAAAAAAGECVDENYGIALRNVRLAFAGRELHDR